VQTGPMHQTTHKMLRVVHTVAGACALTVRECLGPSVSVHEIIACVFLVKHAEDDTASSEGGGKIVSFGREPAGWIQAQDLLRATRGVLFRLLTPFWLLSQRWLNTVL
jgi:hypothetical protein